MDEETIEVAPHNAIVDVTVLCRLDFDGNPDTEGVEAYDVVGNKAGLPSGFSCPLITALGLEKAGIVSIGKVEETKPSWFSSLLPR